MVPPIKYFLVKLFHTNLKILNNLHQQYCKVICENGGDILEIGFGAGITSRTIQTYNINSHTIIEKENYFFAQLTTWAKDKPNVIPIKGDWAEAIPPHKTYDAVLLDTWNNEEEKGQKINLFNTLKSHTKPGTIFVCATTNIFEKELYIKNGNKYEELPYTRPHFKWYHFISKYINKTCNGEILEYRDIIPKVTYK
tara:strand:- start:1075 stop:1662 length:588 start_codon:yes stop_codon:yes gene_type:complete